MNDRQRLLMQKIAEFGEWKWQMGSTHRLEPQEKSAIWFNEINQMVTEWVPVKQEGHSDESSSDLRVVVPQNVTEPYSNKDVTTNVTTRRKKDDLDREVGL